MVLKAYIHPCFVGIQYFDIHFRSFSYIEDIVIGTCSPAQMSSRFVLLLYFDLLVMKERLRLPVSWYTVPPPLKRLALQNIRIRTSN